MDVPRLSSYPYVIVRVACDGCRRRESYRLARLADRFGAEAALDDVPKQLSADCPNRTIKRYKGEYPKCGISLPDLGSPTPPDVPPAVATRRLRVVGGRGEAAKPSPRSFSRPAGAPQAARRAAVTQCR